MTAALLLIGFLLMFIGTLVLLVRAFQVNVGWGIASLLVPFANLVFAMIHWERAKGSFVCALIGTGMFIGGLVKVGASFSQEGLMQALKGEIGTQAERGIEDLTASIQEKRNHIEALEGQIASQGAELTKQYVALEARRAKLNLGDAAAVQLFNTDAAAYQAQNSARKALAQDLEATRQDLQTLLVKRTKLQLAAKAASQPAVEPEIGGAQRLAPAQAGAKSVVMYTTSTCPACARAKSYFARRGISYDERNVDSSPSALEEFRRLGGRGVPLIIVGTERMEGFSAKRLDQLL